MQPRNVTTAAIAAGALLALPSVSEAAVNFGSELKHGPANSEQCDNADQSGVQPCTFVGYRHPVGGPNVPNPAPTDGVVTKLRIRTYPSGPITFAFANISEQGAGNEATGLATFGAVGPTVTPAGTEDIEEFPARVSVQKGMHVALNTPGEIKAVYNSDGGRDSYEFAPQLVAGQGPRGSTDTSGGELLVQAVLEPDADKDGFGDETQDQAPGNPSCTTLPCPVTPDTNGNGNGVKKDTTKPRLTSTALTRAGLKFKLSENARVTIKLRKAGRTVKTISRTRSKGRRTIAFNRSALKPGRYFVLVQAQDAAKNKSATKVLTFRTG